MEWPKLKNIILLLLVMTNLCLLGFLGRQQWKDRKLREEARTQAILFLEHKNVTLDHSLIPEKMTLRPQTVQRDMEMEQAAAEALLGGNIRSENRGAEVYRWFNDAGGIQFHSDGAFSAEFSPGTVPIGENKTETALKLLKKLDFEGEPVDQEGDRLTFRQCWNGVPVFNQQVTVVCREGEIVQLTGGRRLTGQPAEDPGRRTVTVATALFDFYNGLGAMGDVCSRIDGIRLGYVSTASLTGPMALTPVWRIDTDTGSYQLDLITGGLTRLL